MTPMSTAVGEGQATRPMAILIGDVEIPDRYIFSVGPVVVAAACQEIFTRVRGLGMLHGGQIVKMFGDSFVAVFDDILSAFRAATGLRQSLDEKPVGGGLRVTLSLHYGNVTLTKAAHGEDIYGDAVYFAAKVSNEAEQGGITLSAPFFAALPVDAKPSVRMTEHILKGVGKAELYHVVPATTGA